MTPYQRKLVDNFKKQTWTSFKGKKCVLAELDHRHVCNLYYFNKFNDMPIDNGEELLIAIMETILEKHGGKLLPYQPHPQFAYELNKLREMNMIRIIKHVQIIINPDTGKEIGKIDDEYIDYNE